MARAEAHNTFTDTTVEGEIIGFEDAPLTMAEQDELREHEDAISAGEAAFLSVANALTAIQERRLYRADYPSFEAYLGRRWPGISRRRAYQLIEAGATIRALTDSLPAGTPMPTNERQARHLSGLLPDDKARVWHTVSKNGRTPRSADVRKAVDESRPPASRRPTARPAESRPETPVRTLTALPPALPLAGLPAALLPPNGLPAVLVPPTALPTTLAAFAALPPALDLSDVLGEEGQVRAAAAGGTQAVVEPADDLPEARAQPTLNSVQQAQLLAAKLAIVRGLLVQLEAEQRAQPAHTPRIVLPTDAVDQMVKKLSESSWFHGAAALLGALGTVDRQRDAETAW